MAKRKGMTLEQAKERIKAEGITSPTQSEDRLAERYIKIEKHKRGGASSRTEDQYDGTGTEAREAIKNTLRWMAFKPALTDDEVEERILQFFTNCMDNCELPSMEKLALVLGVDFQTMKKWEAGSQGRRRMDMLIRARQAMASIDAELVQKKKIPEVTYIFRSKVMYGYKESNEVVITSGKALASAEELLRQAELLPDSTPIDGEYKEVKRIENPDLLEEKYDE